MIATYARRAGALVLLFAVAFLLAWLAWSRAKQPPPPAGSSRSFEESGSAALAGWFESGGVLTERLDEPRISPTRLPAMLLLVAPRMPVTPTERTAFDQVPREGGTLVVAAENIQLRPYLEQLGVSIEPTRTILSAASPDGARRFPVAAHFRLRAQGATPLLVAPGGDLVALRKPYLQGQLVVLSTSTPLTNAGLRDPDTARWVYQQLLKPLPAGALVAFDESHYGVNTVAGGRPSFANLLLRSPAGAALMFALAVIFSYLVLAGRRLGPPLPPIESGGTARTMFEHVQALAGLYRRAGQRRAARDYFARNYSRRVARAVGLTLREVDPANGDLARLLTERGLPRDAADRLARALAGIGRARNERDLVVGVAAAEAAMSALPRFQRGTLTPT